VLINELTHRQFWQFRNKDELGIYYGHCGVGDNPGFPMSDITKPIIKFGGIRELIVDSLLNMIKLQSWLKSKNINYRFMSFMNYWNDSYFENGKEYPSVKNLGLDALVNEIDFAKFIFADATKNGIFELAKDQNLFADDGIHPNPQAGKLWADIVVEEIQNVKI
jgi:lysophospholipase L1-like esterase